MSPVVIGPFCEAFEEADPTEECTAFARVRVWSRTGLLGAYCRRCWERLSPGLAQVVVRTREVEGHPPPKKKRRT